MSLKTPCGALRGGFASCGKTLLACHSEEPQATRNLAVPRKQLRARFLAALGMTRERVFPQTAYGTTWQGRFAPAKRLRSRAGKEIALHCRTL